MYQLHLMPRQDAWQALYRSANRFATLPDDLGPGWMAHLRAVVQRALARSPGARYATAGDFRDALRGWAAPSAPPLPPAMQPSIFAAAHAPQKRFSCALGLGGPHPAGGQFRRRQHQRPDARDPQGCGADQQAAAPGQQRALCASRGTISTVSRAVSLVGFNAVRNMALNLVLLDHGRQAHASQMREEFLRAMMAGSVAAELCSPGQVAEEAFIGAMFQNLGRMLCEFYFPEEARQVRSLVASGQVEGAKSLHRCRCWGLALKTWAWAWPASGGCPRACSAACANRWGRP